MRVSVVDTLEIADSRKTADGYLAVRANIARDGVYQYTRREIGMKDGDPNELVGVYRSPEYTFNEDALASFAHRPVTVNHPKGGVSSKTWKRDSVGHTGGAVWQSDDKKHVVVDMLLMDERGIEAATTTHKQISAGYSTEIEFEDGVAPDGQPFVAKMTGTYRADHIALVPAGRAGHTCRIGDAAWPIENITDSPATAEKWLRKAIALHEKHMNGDAPTTGKAGDASQELMMTQMKNALSELTGEKVKPKMKMGDTTTHTETLVKDTKKMPSLILDGLKVDLSDEEAVSAAFKKLTDAKDAAIDRAGKAEQSLADAKDGHADAMKEAQKLHDKALGEKDAEIEKLKGQVMDQSAIDKLADAKADIVATARRALGDKAPDFAGKSIAEVRRASVAVKFGDEAVKDRSDDYVEARFDGMIADAKDAPRDNFRDAMANRDVVDFADAAAKAKAARDEMIAGLTSREAAK